VQPKEHIGYRRSAAVPGLEILDCYNSSRQWAFVSYAYAVSFGTTWHGSARYRGRGGRVETDIAFCNYPDEALVGAPDPGSAGSMNVLLIHDGLLREWVAEHQRCAVRPEWRDIFQRMHPELWTKFQRLSESFVPESSALKLQSDATELAETLVRTFVAGEADVAPNAGPAIRGTARMRECLSESRFDVDLETLAGVAGLSKFHALRAFKRRYGLTPYAYQMCLRVRLVRALLLDGMPPAEVAAQCGFGDQSHMIRQFKRVIGVTPTRFARSKTHADDAERAIRRADARVARGNHRRQ
jgi:AraC-like DNA-binding protein